MTATEKKELQEILDELRDYYNTVESTNYLALARSISRLQGLIEESDVSDDDSDAAQIEMRIYPDKRGEP